MSRIIYSKKEYCIIEVFSASKKGFIIFNKNKPFEEGHTHLNNYNAAKYIINLAVAKKIPLDLDQYRMESLYRILPDSDYRYKVSIILQNKKNKTKTYYFNLT